MDLFVENKDISKLSSCIPPPYTIDEGDILVGVEKFVLTANIVSYAKTGDSLGYFNFFPMKNGTRVPTWGYGTVLVSRAKGINIGDKFYGYFPMSKYVTLKPSEMNDSSFVDLAEHRKELSPIYNTYQLCSKVDFYKKEFEDLTIILRPLHLTGWLLADFIEDNKNFNAENVIITSASSKTSIGLAHELSIKGTYRTVGITSERNVDFVKSLELYDDIVTYKEAEGLAAQEKYTIIDMAGNRKLISSIQGVLGDNLTYICAVGNTHWTDESTLSKKAYKVKPVFFFAPTQSLKRIKEWGSDKLVQTMNEAWLNFVKTCAEKKWLEVSYHNGVNNVIKAYGRLSSGVVEPSEAIVCSLWEENTFNTGAKL